MTETAPKRIDRDVLLRLHQQGWGGMVLFAVYFVVFFGTIGLLTWLLWAGHYWLTVPLVFLHAFVMHAFLIAFHESAHDNLCPWPWANPWLGRLVGVFSFMSPTLYRAAHHWHHAYIGDRRDEEFWPFNDPAEPRWKRRLAAFLELGFGLAYTPLLFFHSFVRRDSRVRGRWVRALVWGELAGVVLFWAGVVGALLWLDAMLYLLVIYLVPAWMAGNLQSLRKYVEHIGLTGARVTELTRSVRDGSLAGRAVAYLLFHETFHDVHHLYPRLPQEVLGEAAACERTPAEVPVFSGYGSATWDMVRSLKDPKFGGEWARQKA